MKKREIIPCIAFAVLVLLPGPARAEGETAHSKIFTDGIHKIFMDDPRMKDHFISKVIHRSPYLEETEDIDHGTRAAVGRRDYAGLWPLFDPLNKETQYSYNITEVEDELEMIAHEAVLTDWYMDLFLRKMSIAPGDDYMPGYELANIPFNFTAFNHFSYRPEDFFQGYNCYDIQQGSMFLSYYDAYTGSVSICDEEFVNIIAGAVGTAVVTGVYPDPILMLINSIIAALDVEVCVNLWECNDDDTFDECACELLEDENMWIDLGRSMAFQEDTYVGNRDFDIDQKYHLPHDSWDNDLGGTKEEDEYFMPIWRPGVYWLWRYYHEGAIRFLGPAMHAVTDAGEPQHAGRTMGNFHGAWEAYIGHLWDECGDDYACVGASSLCDAYESKSDCIEDLALDYLERAQQKVLNHEIPELGYGGDGFYGSLQLYAALYSVYSEEGLAVNDVLVPLLDQAVAGYFNSHNIPPAIEDMQECTGDHVMSFRRICGYVSTGAVAPACGTLPTKYGREAVLYKDQYCQDGYYVWCDCLTYGGVFEATFNPDLGFTHYPEITSGAVWLDNNIDGMAKVELDRGIATALAVLAIASEAWVDASGGLPDFDGDEIPDFFDGCPSRSGDSGIDDDDDGWSNECDMCPHDRSIHVGPDPDRDGLAGTPEEPMCDYCPLDNPIWHDPSQNPLFDDIGAGYQGDWDKDGIGDRCDNCTYVPNVERDEDGNQMNCNKEWEQILAAREPRDWFPGVGDACDFEECVDFYHDPGIFGHDLVMPLRATGWRTSPTYMTYSYKPVMKGYCDCEGYTSQVSCQLNKCLPQGSLNDIYISPTVNVSNPAYLGTQTFGPGNIPAVKFQRLYRGEGGNHNCLETTRPKGCLSTDFSDFYDWGTGTFSIYNVDMDWWRLLGCPNIFTPYGDGCSANVMLFFKPVVASWEDRKNNFYDFENLYIIPYAFVPRPSDIYTGVGPYATPFNNEGDPSMQKVASPKVFTIKFFENPGDPMVEVEKWGLPALRDTSAEKGMMIAQFDEAAGDFSGFYPSRFENPGHIIDAKNTAFTREFMAAGTPVQYSVDGVAPDGAVSPIVSELGRLWAFGGRDLAGYRNDLWVGTPIEHSEAVFSWVKIEPLQGAAPPPRESAFLVHDSRNARLLLFGGKNEKGWMKDMWSFDLRSMTWSRIIPEGDVPDFKGSYALVQYMDMAYFMVLPT